VGELERFLEREVRGFRRRARLWVDVPAISPQGVTDASKIGTVVDEQPAGARRAPVGSTVTIYVGRGE
jgi:hypothetical protein